MKVFNLVCEHDHPFEGWFASTEEFERQQRASLLQCPMCDSAKVRRLPSAPRLNLSVQAGAPNEATRSARDARDAETNKDANQQQVMAPTAAQMHEVWVKMARHIQANTEDVGERFAEEARRIHYNEAPERGIRGVASYEEAAELADEGIEVMAVPVPTSVKETLQ